MRNDWKLTASVMVACGIMVGGCAVDDSLPTRPRTATPFTLDPKAQENAEQRTLEAPERPFPTGSGREFPGQSKAEPAKADTDVQVATLADDGGGKPSGFDWRKMGTSHGPVTQYKSGHYPGPLPVLPETPGTVPAVGSVMVPGTPWSIDYSWGEALPLTDYPHRAWPESKATYEVAKVKHNPVYYFNLEDIKPMGLNNGTYAGDVGSSLVEVPWFYLNTAALPVLMVLEPPLIQRSTNRLGSDPNYHGYLPEGPTVPAPTTGVLKWEYRYLNPDGSIKEKDQRPAATTRPATNP